jgi:hypothetical protein
MGMFKKSSGSIYEANKGDCLIKLCPPVKDTKLPNPNPENFKIIASLCCEDFLIVRVNYPDCTNFEGDKILVYQGDITAEDLAKRKTLDPHFHDNPKHPSPIARFEPTEEGWRMAKIFVLAMSIPEIE